MNRVKDFLVKELIDFDNFKYNIEESGEYIYVIFNEIFGNESDKELTFKIFDEEKILYLHSTSFGWKAVEKGSLNKFFWIEILS